ncbi:MAG: ribonuclease III [Leptolyngbyaceae cyanobacterium SL_1_1]|nr:ribonuclease III [Leptolyngbyaceae cyanobacterium RM1_1_2]NJO09516.1 ribonuclease III [Leptolyngbyaceae cyanobacterium SL_1_1]
MSTPVLLTPERQLQLQQLIVHLGLPAETEVDWEILNLALIHPSFQPNEAYERLEFLGDAALRLAASEFLLKTLPTAMVGEVAELRSRLVSDRILAELANDHNVEQFLWLSEAAIRDRAGRGSRLADTFEAILGALYSTTQNTELIHPWLDPHFQRLTAIIRSDPARQNYKAALQEWTQAHYRELPEYRVQELSQQHGDPERFGSAVWFQSRQWGAGKGSSIKLAEQAAARQAYEALQSAADSL